jgi:GxxExxY protein
LLVSESVIVELKSVDEIAPIHKAQLLSYLKLSGKKVGLLINFNVELLKNGYHADGELAVFASSLCTLW